MTNKNLKVFVILKRLTSNTDEPVLVFLEKDINQASLFFEGYVDNFPKKDNFILKMFGEFTENAIKKGIIIKRIYKNKEKIKKEYEQKKLQLNDYILKQDKHNMVDNLISVFKGKIVK